MPSTVLPFAVSRIPLTVNGNGQRTTANGPTGRSATPLAQSSRESPSPVGSDGKPGTSYDGTVSRRKEHLGMSTFTEARLAAAIAELRTEMAELRAEIERRINSQTRWVVGWNTGLAAIIIAVLR